MAQDDATPVERPARSTSRVVVLWGAIEVWLARDEGRQLVFAMPPGRGLSVYVYRSEDDLTPVVERVSPVEDPLTAALRAISQAGP
jgi:hypothetical protein